MRYCWMFADGFNKKPRRIFNIDTREAEFCFFICFYSFLYFFMCIYSCLFYLCFSLFLYLFFISYFTLLHFISLLCVFFILIILYFYHLFRFDQGTMNGIPFGSNNQWKNCKYNLISVDMKRIKIRFICVTAWSLYNDHVTK